MDLWLSCPDICNCFFHCFGILMSLSELVPYAKLYLVLKCDNQTNPNNGVLTTFFISCENILQLIINIKHSYLIGFPRDKRHKYDTIFVFNIVFRGSNYINMYIVWTGYHFCRPDKWQSHLGALKCITKLCNSLFCLSEAFSTFYQQSVDNI